MHAPPHAHRLSTARFLTGVFAAVALLVLFHLALSL